MKTIRTMLVRDFNKKKKNQVLDYKRGNTVLHLATISYHSTNKKGEWVDPRSFKLKRVGIITVVYPSYC